MSAWVDVAKVVILAIAMFGVTFSGVRYLKQTGMLDGLLGGDDDEEDDED